MAVAAIKDYTRLQNSWNKLLPVFSSPVENHILILLMKYQTVILKSILKGTSAHCAFSFNVVDILL